MNRCAVTAIMLSVIHAVAAAQPATIVDFRRSVAPSTKEWEFNVPPFSVEHQVRLSLEARIDRNRLAGSNHWLRVAVNGTYLTKRDLLNKRNEFTIRRGLDLLWVKGDRWRLLYSPDFKAAIVDKDNPNACPDADPYRFVWDVTAYVKPGANKLRIRHLKVLAKPSTLVLRNVKLEVGKPISPPSDETVAPAPTGPVPTFVAKGPQRVAMRVTLSPDGAIAIRVGGKTIEVLTRTSLPEGKWREAEADGGGTALTSASPATVTWQTPMYRIRRQATLRADHVHVADTITNTDRQLIGVIVEHRVKPVEKPTQLRLGGWVAYGETARRQNAQHPSVFAQWGGLGLGLVAEDDVFRAHVQSFMQPEGFGLVDRSLGIEPGKSITLEWSIYPTPDGDYWDFVNAVRRNWDTNFPIPGPYWFVSGYRTKKWSAQQWGEWMRKRGVRFACGGIAKYANGKYAHGTGILSAPEWVERERAWVSKIKAAAPQVVPTAYFHAQCCTEPNGETTYTDCRLLDHKREHLHYPYRYPLPLYLPTRENSYGKAVYGFLDTLIDTIGVEAVYWDEMSHSVLRYAEHAPWDGCSAKINSNTHALIGKWTSVPLLMQPLKLALIRHIRGRVKYLFANTQPATRTMMRQKIVRFVETGTYSAVTNTHLGCPWALANHHQEKTHADAALNVRRILAFGGVYCPYIYYRDPASWNFTDVMYPITPVELREGMVLGKERIHTTRSGRFGWPDGAAADVYVVDSQGARADRSMVKEIVRNGKRVYEIRMPGDHFAILVRRDA